MCWPQLKSTTVRWICAAPGPAHEFDVSWFYYESQGRYAPRRCVEYRESDATESRDATGLRNAVVGGNLFARLARKVLCGRG
jgi:hypothetical protein